MLAQAYQSVLLMPPSPPAPHGLPAEPLPLSARPQLCREQVLVGQEVAEGTAVSVWNVDML